MTTPNVNTNSSNVNQDGNKPMTPTNRIPGLSSVYMSIGDVTEITINEETDSHDGGGGTDFCREIIILNKYGERFTVQASSHNVTIPIQIKKSDIKI